VKPDGPAIVQATSFLHPIFHGFQGQKLSGWENKLNIMPANRSADIPFWPSLCRPCQYLAACYLAPGSVLHRNMALRSLETMLLKPTGLRTRKVESFVGRSFIPLLFRRLSSTLSLSFRVQNGGQVVRDGYGWRCEGRRQP
jgi:hypothetical protein